MINSEPNTNIKIEKPSKPAVRLDEIDGIRGWASLVVLFFHFTVETFGELVPEFLNPFVHFFVDGHLAVYVFFLLSGDALSVSFTKSEKGVLPPSMVIKRYFRLAGPILFSCATVFLLMISGFTFNHPAAEIVKRPDWLGEFLPFQPSLWNMIHYSLFDAFGTHDGSISYNNFLWPMGIEFVGSLLVFSFALIHNQLKRPQIVLAICSLFLTIGGSYYSLFFLGILFGYLRTSGFFSNLQNLSFNHLASAIASIGLIFMDGLLEYKDLKTPQVSIVLATLTVMTCYSSRFLLSIMRNSLSRYLGHISFPLYFMHFSILISLTSWLILTTDLQWRGQKIVYIFIAFVSIVASLGVAAIVTKIESLYLQKINIFTKKITKSS